MFVALSPSKKLWTYGQVVTVTSNFVGLLFNNEMNDTLSPAINCVFYPTRLPTRYQLWLICRKADIPLSKGRLRPSIKAVAHCPVLKCSFGLQALLGALCSPYISPSTDGWRHSQYGIQHNMSCVMRKPVFRVSNRVQHKLGCKAT